MYFVPASQWKSGVSDPFPHFCLISIAFQRFDNKNNIFIISYISGCIWMAFHVCYIFSYFNIFILVNTFMLSHTFSYFLIIFILFQRISNLIILSAFVIFYIFMLFQQNQTNNGKSRNNVSLMFHKRFANVSIAFRMILTNIRTKIMEFTKIKKN